MSDLDILWTTDDEFSINADRDRVQNKEKPWLTARIVNTILKDVRDYEGGFRGYLMLHTCEMDDGKQFVLDETSWLENLRECLPG